MTVHDTIAAKLTTFGGVLRCHACHREQPVGGSAEIAGALRGGWPTCHGQTMQWYTERELRAEREGQ